MASFKKFLTVFFCFFTVLMLTLAIVGLGGQVIALFTLDGGLAVTMEETCMTYAAVCGCFATLASFIMAYLDNYESND